MTVLATGATGFIGAQLVDRLLAAGGRVRALVRPGTDASRLEARGVEVLRGDIRDLQAVRRAAAGTRVVYHLVKAPHGASAALLRAVNGAATEQLAHVATETGARVVLAGSAAVYGVRVPGIVAEDAPIRPDSEYARSKALGERAVQAAGGVVARISTVLGPGARAWRRMFADVEGGRFRMAGAGDNRHHLVDVEDVVDGVLRCGAVPGIEGRVYNLAADEPLRLRELVRLIAEELGVPDTPRRFPAAPLRVYRRLSDLLSRTAGVALPRASGLTYVMSDRALDISRARHELGFAPRFTPREAIRRTADWYRLRPTPPAPDAAAGRAPR